MVDTVSREGHPALQGGEQAASRVEYLFPAVYTGRFINIDKNIPEDVAILVYL
jgi:hypothetical protein